MDTVHDASEEREKVLRRRKLLKHQICSHSKEFNSMAMFVRAKDPCGVQALRYLRGTVPHVRTVSWLQVLKTLSIEGLCQCLLRVPRHDKHLRKAIICLIAIKRLEQLDRRLATHLTQIQNSALAAAQSAN
jgi:hypothetical protein